MKPPPFEYARPASLEEAIALLAQHNGDAKAIAGGQSLMPMLAFRLAAPSMLVDITRIQGLNSIDIDENGISLGALVRWRDIERHAELAAAHPLLAAAIRHVAHYQIRNRGTVGGSVAHADPAAEMPGIAATCDAEIIIAGAQGRRSVRAEEFFTGSLTTALAAEELIAAVRLPTWKHGRRWAFEEFARRRGDFALAGVALYYDLDTDAHVVDPHVGAIGVADRPIRLKSLEQLLAGRVVDEALVREAAATAAASVSPDDDIHAPGDYRRSLLGVLVERALARAAGLQLAEQA